MNKKLFYACLFVSVGVHIAAGWAFYKQPLFLRPYFGASIRKPASVVIPVADEDIALSERNISLEEVMSHIIELPMQEQLSQNNLTLVEKKTTPSQEKTDDFIISNSLNSENPCKIFTEETTIAGLNTLNIPTPFEENFILPEAPLSFISKLDTNKELESNYVQNIEQALASDKNSLSEKELEPTLTTQYSVLAETSLPLRTPQELELPEIISLEKNILQEPFATPSEFLTEAPEFYALPTHPKEPSILDERTPPVPPQSKSSYLNNHSFPVETIGKPWDEGFDVEISTMQKEEGGYFFSVTLLPKYDMTKKQMHQNYYFLIDRTNSIGKHRYQTFKRAVTRALSSLDESARFNIVVFDKKVISLSEKPIAYSKKSLQLAESFLEKQEHGSYFTAADLCKSLSKIIPESVKEDEETSVILITDGDSSLNEEKQRKIIQSFLQKNKGKISLYTAAVGEGNNLNFLDLLSHLNKGCLLYSDTHASFPRKLTKLTLDLLHPIAKDITASVIKQDPRSHIKLQLGAAPLPSLFSKRPYTIYGVADSLKDFTLVLQGRNKNQLLSIKKNISFANAKQDRRALSKQWSQKQAHICYEEYLKNGEVALLEQAQNLLDKSGH